MIVTCSPQRRLRRALSRSGLFPRQICGDRDSSTGETAVGLDSENALICSDTGGRCLWTQGSQRPSSIMELSMFSPLEGVRHLGLHVYMDSANGS